MPAHTEQMRAMCSGRDDEPFDCSPPSDIAQAAVQERCNKLNCSTNHSDLHFFDVFAVAVVVAMAAVVVTL